MDEQGDCITCVALHIMFLLLLKGATRLSTSDLLIDWTNAAIRFIHCGLFTAADAPRGALGF
jgi:hypothetical protein